MNVSQREVEKETLANMLRDVVAGSVVNTMADLLANVKARTIGNKLGDVVTEAVFERLADTLPNRAGRDT